MKIAPDLMLGYGRAARHLTEYRELDIYDRSKHLVFEPDDTRASDRVAENIAARVSALRVSAHALSDHLAARDPLLGEATGSWQRYLALPRKTLTEKMVAEVFRILRIVQVAATHAQGLVSVEQGLLTFDCTFNRCALAVSLTETGVELLGAFVAYYLEASRSPYSETYCEWMLGQYFTDIVAEIKKFADEDRVLYQFAQRGFFNRHFRYDCDSPNVRMESEYCEIQINKLQSDPVSFPFDFYLIVKETLHIVPVEALRDARLPLDKLPLWKVRTPDGLSLPSSFRGRFVRERMIQGQPMT